MKKLIILAMCVSLMACVDNGGAKTNLEGKIIPDFKFKLLDSSTYLKTINLAHNKPFILFFYSPHCPYCRKQTELMLKSMNKLDSTKIYMLTSFSIKEAKSFSSEYNLTKYPNIISGIDSLDIIRHYYKAPGIPYLAIYDKSSKLRKTFLGKVEIDKLENSLQE